MSGGVAPVSAIAGIDGCGKTSTFRDVVEELALSIPVVGIGELVLRGGPGAPLAPRTDIPLSRSARVVGSIAKRRRVPVLYKNLKFLEFIERTRIRDHVLARDPPAAVVTDGDPLVNVAAWAAARFYRDELAEDDQLLFAALHYMAGDWRIPAGEMRYYLGHAWQLVLLNRLHLARFRFPDQVFLLEIDPAVSMERIRARGRPLQAHENVQFLGLLSEAYQRVCAVLEGRCGVPVVRIRVDQQRHGETVKQVAEAVLARVSEGAEAAEAESYAPDSIEIIATTMSGSIEDQRKVGRIGPEFQARGSMPARVHLARSHSQAAALAHRIVAGGGRTIVSAGGAGTFNAVLEGSHIDGSVPADLRLAFLRKGSADLIGKALNIPDDLPAAVEAIESGIATDRCVAADVLTIEAEAPDGGRERRHMVGFGGVGVFGDVPRFTETRIIKFYKGILGSLFGDLGPFYVGLALAALWWWVRHLFRRTPHSALSLDGDTLPPDDWAAVILLNGDLGKDFPLGRGLSLSSGSFRVVALRYRGVGRILGQIDSCRTATVLDRPDDYAAIVREVRTLGIRPIGSCPPQMINVDGLRMMASGEVRVSVSDRVQLVAGWPAPDRHDQ